MCSASAGADAKLVWRNGVGVIEMEFESKVNNSFENYSWNIEQ